MGGVGGGGASGGTVPLVQPLGQPMLVDRVALARLHHKQDDGVGAAVRAVRGGERLEEG